MKKWAACGPEDRRFLVLALCGEAGELANLVKKEWRGDLDRSPERELGAFRAMLADEMADCQIYLNLIALAYDVDLEAACAAKVATVYDKFGWERPS